MSTALFGSTGIVCVLLAIGPAGHASQGTAQQPPPAARPDTPPAASTPLFAQPERKPYGELFSFSQLQPRPNTGPQILDVMPTPQPRVDPCGMVLLDDRRNIDPRMIVPAPQGNFAVRRVVPETCRGNGTWRPIGR